MGQEKSKMNPKWSGFFIAAWFLVVGITLFYTPIYIGLNGLVGNIINFLGWIAIIISLVGSFVELSNIFKNDGLSNLGVSLVFLIPAVLLHIFQEKSLSNHIGIIILKTIVICFILLGTGLLLYGISFFLENDNDNISKEFVVREKKTRKPILEHGLSIIVAILGLITAIIQLVN